MEENGLTFEEATAVNKLIELKSTKDKRIKREISKLKRIFRDMDADTKSAAESLIRNAAFMLVTLEDLSETINTNGVISTYQNGENQFGTKKSPEIETYNVMIKNHMSIIKQLTELLPKTALAPKEDGFDKFVGSRDD